MFSAARRARLALATQILDVDPVFEGSWQRAGAAAETDFIDWLARHAKGAQVFHSKRIPRGEGRGRYEIDVILLTPHQLTVIEVKNWSGQILERGESWVKRRNDGSWLVQDNPVPKTEAKLDALECFCLAKGLRLPPWLSTAVVLWNEQARPDAAILAQPSVVRKEEAVRLLPQKSRGGLQRGQMQALVQALDQIEGFDCVTLFGGRKVQGDLLRLVIGGRSLSLANLPSGVQTRLKMPRHPFWVRFKALVGFGPMIRLEGALKGLDVKPTDRLVFHPAGEPVPVEIPLAALRSFERG